MPADGPISARRVIGVAIAGGVVTAVIIELVGHLSDGTHTTAAAGGAAIVVATGISAALKKKKARQRS